MNGKDVAVIAHGIVVLLSLFGVVKSADSMGIETAIAAATVAGSGLVSQAIVLWKYIHHHGD